MIAVEEMQVVIVAEDADVEEDSVDNTWAQVEMRKEEEEVRPEVTLEEANEKA